MKNYRRYPEYKDSGIEWLGKIPAHWEVKRLKRLATINDEVLPETTDPNFEISYVDIGSVDSTDGIAHRETYVFANAPSRARRIVRHGDVIVSTVRTYLRAIVPIVHPEPNLIVSTGFAVIRPRVGLATRFSAYALQSPYFVERVVANSVGVSYPAINASELGTFPIAVPPEVEQCTIADFLDRETAKIDALIGKKERLIELLKEKRTVLISHAVTKGLDPNVSMKDSGIEWLGKIPAHWEVVRLKYHAQFDNSGIWGDEPETCDAPIPVARTADISIDGRINFQDMPMRCLSAAEMKAYKCRPGEIIVVKSSGSVSNVVTGKAALVTQEMPTFSFSNFLLRVIPSQVVWDSRFLYAFLTSHMVRKRIELMVSGTTYPNLKVSEYRGFEVPLPNQPEQQAIADFLDCETAKIDALIGKIEKAIELLKEYRTALISAAVTGKIDVRDGVEEQEQRSHPRS